MADHTLTPEQMAALAAGQARIDPHPDGVALTVGDDRLILPTHGTDTTDGAERLLAALCQIENVLGAAYMAAITHAHARRRRL